jgi:hypothetical protein
LHWGTEIFISSLHELLFNFKEQLWKKGQWSEDNESRLLKEIVPDTARHLAYDASRVSRPNYPKPRELSTGENKLYVIDDNSSEYDGWTRLAIQETEYINDPNSNNWQPPNEVVRVYSNVVSKEIGSVFAKNIFPFEGGGDKNSWWVKANDPFLSFVGIQGRLVGSARIEDWLGSFILLIPPAAIHDFIDIKTPSYGEPLIWHDEDSKPTVAMRTWRIRNTNNISVDTEPDEILGCDLIIRPDIAKILEDNCNGTLVELCFTHKKSIKNESK